MAKSSDSAPRISVNKLAEFMVVKGARQRQILYDQKYPSEYKGMYYREAAEAISFSIASNLEDISSVQRGIAILEQANPEKIGSQRRIQANIDAMEGFLTMLDAINLKDATPTLGASSSPKLTVFNVHISVRPEIFLTSNGKKHNLVGALKLHFPRTFPLNEDAAGYVSAITQEWCKLHLCDTGIANGGLCPVIDVGSQKVYPGVKATTARMKEVEATCQNIAALWPSI